MADDSNDPVDPAQATAREARQRAELLEADAKARMADADLRSVDADAQTAHAKTGIAAADAHMEAARRHMESANQQEADAEALQARADEQMAEAATLLAEASEDSAEYQRAIYHYTQLVRHRMANPIQVIRGMAETLVEMPDLPAERRDELHRAILDQAKVLERVSFEPRTTTDAERGLRPRPHED